MSYSIEDKVILITGANRGIGRALAESFLAHKAKKIYAAVRSVKSAQSLVDEYKDKVSPIQIDLSDSQSIYTAAESATDVEVVVNNAGILKTAAPLDTSAIESIQLEMQVNVYGLIHMAQAFAPVLKANGGGVFAQLNSVASLKCFSSFTTYSASKAAAYSVTQALRENLRDQGTIVLSIHPGPIATDMADTAGVTEGAEPPSVVADGMIAALKSGDFHVFPDTMAEQFGRAYKSFAESVIGGW